MRIYAIQSVLLATNTFSGDGVGMAVLPNISYVWIFAINEAWTIIWRHGLYRDRQQKELINYIHITRLKIHNSIFEANKNDFKDENNDSFEIKIKLISCKIEIYLHVMFQQTSFHTGTWCGFAWTDVCS